MPAHDLAFCRKGYCLHGVRVHIFSANNKKINNYASFATNSELVALTAPSGRVPYDPGKWTARTALLP